MSESPDKDRRSSYDATDPEVITRQEALIQKILGAPQAQTIPAGWEEEETWPEGFELNPDWKVVPNPWDGGAEITAAAIIAEDEDDASRHFAIIGKREDSTLQYYGFLYRLHSDRILMKTPDPDEKLGALPIAWDGLDGRAFLELSEALLG